MTKYKLPVMLPALVAAIFLAAPAAAQDAGVQSLRATDVAIADEAPPEKALLGERPGKQKPIPRTFEQQPPLIPHAMTNFDEITPEANQCLDCHSAETYKKKNAPKLGDSHFRDLRTGKVMKEMSAARYQCTLCHVPQADAMPLVENTFQAAAPVKKR